MLDKKHVVGIGASMALSGTFGLMIGGVVGVFAAVPFQAPIDGLATGPTPIPVSQLTTPLGFTPAVIGLPSNPSLVLPGIPVTVDIFGVVLSVSGFTLAEVSGGGGMVFGFFLGLYYAIDIAREQRTQTQTDV